MENGGDHALKSAFRSTCDAFSLVISGGDAALVKYLLEEVNRFESRAACNESSPNASGGGVPLRLTDGKGSGGRISTDSPGPLLQKKKHRKRRRWSPRRDGHLENASSAQGMRNGPARSSGVRSFERKFEARHDGKGGRFRLPPAGGRVNSK